MPEPEQHHPDPLFFQLVSSFYSAAMLQMGKIMNPMTGKAERQMEMARNTIDLLGMLQTKTAGNLDETEREYLTHVLYELRMNYVDETEHPSISPETPSTSSTPSTPSTSSTSSN